MKRPNIKDKDIILYVEYLENQLKKFNESPKVNTYLTIYNQLESFNSQLVIRNELQDDGKTKKGFIDLFAGKDAKEFDRVKWYFENALALNKNLDELRKGMTPEQQAELKEREKIQGLGVAEKLALNGNGKGRSI